jgi:hypothetical protein
MVKVVIDIPAKIRRRCKIFSVFIINHLLICKGNDYQRESQMFYDANSNKSSLLTLLTNKIGKTGVHDHPLPILADHLNLLISNT